MKRVLVAGIGNVFFGDDGFGVAVARRLARDRLPPGVKIVDYGIRCMHLAFELLEPLDLLVMIDAMSRNGRPGTLYLVDPGDEPDKIPGTTSDPHGMNPSSVLATLRQLGGTLPTTRIVGCEPLDIGEGMHLSAPVQQAIEPAVAMIRALLGAGTRTKE